MRLFDVRNFSCFHEKCEDREQSDGYAETKVWQEGLITRSSLMGRMFCARWMGGVGIVLGLLLSSAGPLSAYNTDTHQHIAELGYAYLKAVDLCEPIPLGGGDALATCSNQCTKVVLDNVRNMREEGYTCSCAEAACETSCGGLTGIDKFSCVEQCVATGVGQQCASDNSCESPYFWVPNQSEVITSLVCTEECFEETNLTFADECTAFSSVLASEKVTAQKARDTVAFYQEFETSACPPTTYDYHNRDACNSNNLNTVRKPLAEWKLAVFGAKTIDGTPDPPNVDVADDPELFPEHTPVLSAGVLSATNTVENGDEEKTDFTGTIIGFHANAVDHLMDMYTTHKILPVVEDSLKLASQIGVGAGGGALAAVVAVGGVVACAVGCVFTLGFGDFCEDCFDAVYNATKNILEGTKEFIDDIEETHWFAAGTGPTTAGHENTSMSHFMNTEGSAKTLMTIPGPSFGKWDDTDGWRPAEAFGPGGAFVQGLLEAGIDLLWEIRIDYPMSQRAIDNYHVEAPDDLMKKSDTRGVHYWHSFGMPNYTFLPVDNLANYWWHKWLQGRVTEEMDSDGQSSSVTEQTYGLLPLGGVLHGVQDITQPYHTWGITAQGHAPYEDRLSNFLDPTLHRNKNGDGPAVPLLINLNDPAQEQIFLQRVGEFIEQIYTEVIDPAGGVLHMRRLAHFLYSQVTNAETEIKLSTDLPGLSWFDYDIEDQFVRETGVPLAVAATVVVLLEGASQGEALDAYENQLNLDMQSFQNKGPVPPLTSALPEASSDMPFEQAGLSATDIPIITAHGSFSVPEIVLAAGGNPSGNYSDIPAGYIDAHPSWVCAGDQLRARKAVQQYYTNQIKGRDLVSIVLAEKMRCDFLALGMPVPPDATLDSVAQYEAEQLQATTGWFGHGSSNKVEKDLACKSAKKEDLFSPAAIANFKARCNNTLDSDGDGVFDDQDQCWTPVSENGMLHDTAMAVVVQPNGCMFNHELAPPTPPINPFIPGTIRVAP